MGSTIGLSVDARDHVWVLHRPQTVEDNFKAADLEPPVGACCSVAPPVLEFDPAGNLVGHWGGPGAGYEWPESLHGITVDHEGNVWIGGNGDSDTQILKFTRTGQFLLQVGKQGVHHGSNDPQNFWRAAKIVPDPAANEVYVADGYGNRRVVVLDAATGRYKRHWGAYGERPDDAPLPAYDPKAPPSKQFDNVHCASVSKDGFVYVCDRANDRVQVFRKDGSFVEGGLLREGDAALGLGLGHRVLEGSAADLPLRRERREPDDQRRAAQHARGPHRLRRRRTPARPVLRRPQPRHRLERQPVRHGDVQRRAGAALRLQGRGPGHEAAVNPTDPQPTCSLCPGYHIPASELRAYTEKGIALKLTDQQVRDVEIGKAHVGIAMVHRDKLDAPLPNSVAEHDLVSEVYHVTSGSATLVLGPDIADRERRPATLRNVRELNGPGHSGSEIRGGVAYQIQTGDVVVIPAGTGHWFTKIDDHIDYLMVRIDPDKVTPLKDEAASKAYLSKPASGE